MKLGIEETLKNLDLGVTNPQAKVILLNGKSSLYGIEKKPLILWNYLRMQNYLQGEKKIILVTKEFEIKTESTFKVKKGVLVILSNPLVMGESSIILGVLPAADVGGEFGYETNANRIHNLLQFREILETMDGAEYTDVSLWGPDSALERGRFLVKRPSKTVDAFVETDIRYQPMPDTMAILDKIEPSGFGVSVGSTGDKKYLDWIKP